MKTIIITTIAIFIAWLALDFLFHNILLQQSYEDTASLWREKADIKMNISMIATLLSATMFSSIYVFLIKDKGPINGLTYGLLYGTAVGAGMGFGTYSFMPIPYYLALSWFVIMVIKGAVSGVLIGLITKPKTTF